MILEPRILTNVQQLGHIEGVSRKKELGLFKAQERNMRSGEEKKNRY